MRIPRKRLLRMVKVSWSSPLVLLDLNGEGIARLFKRLEPNFDTSRLVLKVSCTWEGMQACLKLKDLGIQTLATTVFTIPQAVLAGEVGVKSISPFCHELRAHFEEEYVSICHKDCLDTTNEYSHHDPEPIVELCVQAQNYYEQHGVSTVVKACAMMTIDEILQLAGVAAITIPTGQLDELAASNRPKAELESLSLFRGKAEGTEKVSYTGDEEKYRTAFSEFNGGRGEAKTKDVSNYSACKARERR